MVKLWTKSFIKMAIGLLLLFTAFYMLYPTLPLFILEIGGNESHAGLIMGAFMLASVVFRPFIGGLIDLYGRRAFLIPGVILFALSMFAYQWISGILILVLIRVIHGISWGMSTTSFLTSITDIIPSNRRGEGLGWASMAMTLSMAIGPVIGVWLVDHYSHQHVFLSGFFLAILALILIIQTPIPFHRKENNVSFVFFDRSLTFVGISTFLFFFSYGGITTYIPLYAASIEFNSGTFFLIFAASLIVSRPLSGKLADKYGYSQVIIPALCITIGSLLIIGTVSGSLGIILAAILYGIGFGSTQPALQATTIRLVSSNRTGVANASFSTSADLGIGLGAIVLGWFATYTNYQMLFIISSISVACSFLLFNFFVRKSLLKTKNQAA